MEANTRIIDMTAGELESMLQRWATGIVTSIQNQQSGCRKVEYGLDGIMRICGCSKSTAQRIKNSGVIDEAISQPTARKIVIDVEKALELLPTKFIKHQTTNTL